MSRLTLVTGAGGFLGRHVARRLLARDEAVRGLDLRFESPLDAAIEQVPGSILDGALRARALDGVDALIHCAAVTDLWQRESAIYRRVNVEGTRAVFTAAARAGVRRAVHVSSYVTLIAGPRLPERTVREEPAPPLEAMIGCYAHSKWQAERAAFGAAGQMEVVAVLPSAPLGPEDWRLTPPSRLVRDLANGAIPATLDCLVNFVDVGAVAEAIIAARDRGESGGRYLLAGTDISMREFLAAFARVSGVSVPRSTVPYALALAAAFTEERLIAPLTGRPPRAPLAGVRLAGRRVRFDSARARAALGFAPPPLEDSLRAALGWMVRAGMVRRPLPGLAGYQSPEETAE